MAENSNAKNSSPEEIRKDLERQIGELRKEVAKLGKSLSARGEALYDEAGEAYDTASRKARGAARQARQQAYVVSEAIRENPGTAATVLSSAGLIGLLIGIAIGHMLSNEGKSHRWY